MAQPIEDKGYKDVFRESASAGPVAGPLQKLASRFGFATGGARGASSGVNKVSSDQQLLAEKSGYIDIGPTSSQFNQQAAAEKREKEDKQKESAFTAIFKQAASAPEGSFLTTVKNVLTTLIGKNFSPGAP